MSSTTNSHSTAIYSLNWSSNEIYPSLSSKSPQISINSPVQKIENNPKCYCRFLWNYELHGLTRFLSVRTWKAKIFWGAVIATCLMIAAFTTSNVVGEYFERQTTTLITLRRVKELLYPTIVVCPKNADALNMTLVRQDILYHLPGLDGDSINNLIAYAVAGAGFDNMGTIVETWSSAEISRLDIYFKRWKNSRSSIEFYETLFNKYGYQCSELFDSCYYGSETLQCCKVFKPVFVMLRGRCFQLTNFSQRDPDEVGKISLYLNQISSPLIDPKNSEAQVVVYISDRFPDIATFPRFYLNFLQWNRMRFTLKEIDMLPTVGQCEPRSQGRATCFVNNWLKHKVIEQYNCSVFYLSHKRPDVEICDPEIIVRNYDSFVDPSLKDYACIPPCLRFDTGIEIYTAMEMAGPQGTIDLGTSAFRIEASYISLEYESYKEILTTSPQGFISELGGQSGLFLGLSVITIIQLFYAIGKSIFFKIRNHFIIENSVYYGQ